jgi:hypothetical protein
MSGNSRSNQPSAQSQISTGGTFSDFVTRILTVPRSEIKAKLDAEKAARDLSKASSRVSGGKSKHT